MIKLTMQQTFDYIVQKLTEQGVQAINDNGTCKLFHEGNKCAIGWLISDEKYSSSLEYTKISDLIKQRVIDAKFYVEEYFLARMQIAHDLVIHSIWTDSFLRIATEFNLDSSLVKKMPDGLKR